jgi:hypothetical protein
VADLVTIPREQLEAAFNYIMHCGSNAIMRGEEHPQKQIVDWLELALAQPPNAEEIRWAEEQLDEVERALGDDEGPFNAATFSAARHILRQAKRG